jgi:hypothetical protein
LRHIFGGDVYRCGHQHFLKLRQERHHDMSPRTGLVLMSHSIAIHISSLRDFATALVLRPMTID